MTTGQILASQLQQAGLITPANRLCVTQILEQELEKIMLPDLLTAIRIVAVNLHAQGKFFVEIAVDKDTKEVAHSFVALSPAPVEAAARELMKFLWANVGTSADWPVELKVDGDHAEELTAKLNALKDALKLEEEA